MQLNYYLDRIKRDYLGTAELGGEEAQALAEKLIAPLDASLRLAMIELISDAASEVTAELTPTSIEVKLVGKDPSLIVRKAAFADPEQPSEDVPSPRLKADMSDVASADPDAEGDGDMRRTTVRLPEGLKTRIDEAAAKEGVSVNAWLIGAAESALAHVPTFMQSGSTGKQHYIGWV